MRRPEINFNNILYTTRQDEHYRVFLIPCKKLLVLCSLFYMRTLDKSRYQKHTAMSNLSPCILQRVCHEQGWPMGGLVGYHVGLDKMNKGSRNK